MAIRKVSLLMLIVALAAGITALLLANNYIQEQYQSMANSAPQAKTVTVVVAAQQLPMGTQLETKHLTIKEMPEDAADSKHFQSVDEVVGRVARDAIYEGEMIRPERVALPGEGNSLAAIIDPKKRAVTIRVNDVIGVAGFLLPGNLVDILSSVQLNRNQVVTETVLKEIKVLAVDQTARTDENKPVIVRAVTLEVTPKEAEKLMTASNKGRIQLALRNPIEQDPEPVVKAKPKPRIYRPSSSSVTVIKGTDTSKVKVQI